MKRKIGFLVGLLAVVGLVIGGFRVFGGGSKEGVLKVQSTPTASVFLDNKHMGRTPVETNVAAGDYTIRLVPETTTQTLASWQGNVKITPEILTYVNASLAESEFATAVETMWLEKITSKLAEVSVTTNPDGATASLDGETKGITPVSIPNVAAGDHSLAIASPGFVSRNMKIKTTAGYKLNAIVKLALSGESVQEASASPTPTPTKAASSTDPAKPFVTIKDTPTGFLRVRMEPTTAATEAAQVKPGEKYSIVDSKQDAKGTTWYEIQYDGKNTGWISGQYTEKTE
ncbi:PEGA domain-containing protein [Candidatus Gottesmanbacteria bacterium]|nr:PEGA domain-containing protein [Candidatus Gottesmanbacteria bacterium]